MEANWPPIDVLFIICLLDPYPAMLTKTHCQYRKMTKISTMDTLFNLDKVLLFYEQTHHEEKITQQPFYMIPISCENFLGHFSNHLSSVFIEAARTYPQFERLVGMPVRNHLLVMASKNDQNIDIVSVLVMK